jgi:hypothetical protein
MATFRLPRLQDRKARPGTRDHRRWRRFEAGFWAVVGGIVVLYIFFAALGGIDPAEATASTIIVLVLAVGWLAHSWRRLWSDENLSNRMDRERRGF